jgi:hypothetical protein
VSSIPEAAGAFFDPMSSAISDLGHSAHASRLGVSVGRMKKRKGSKVRKEYDFSNGVRGKYIHLLAKGTNLVALDEDVFALFPDSKSVNDALRKHAGLPTPRKRKK